MNDEAVLNFIGARAWRYAETMPEWPHEYTIKSWRPDVSGQFEWFCRQIHADGAIEPWPPPPALPIYHNRYLVVGEHTYWAMGPSGDQDSPQAQNIINRAELAPASGGAGQPGARGRR